MTEGTTAGDDGYGNRQRQQARRGDPARSTRGALEAVAHAALHFRAAEERAARALDHAAPTYADGHADGHADGQRAVPQAELVERALAPLRVARAALYQSLEALGAGDDD